jgi:8-oxo-dGTP pyrophosphatase MutT (NUDIX family)
MNLRPLELWKTLSRKTIFHHSKFLTVENHTIELPSGQMIPDWAWIITPDAALILAETNNHKYLCFHQTKYAVGTTLAPVGGHVEPGEDPIIAAKRELLEETGYQATEWIHLGSYIVGPNRGIAKRHLYFARNATKVTSPCNDDLEEQQLLLLDHSELEDALQKGRFKIVSWVSLIALSLQYMQNK